MILSTSQSRCHQTKNLSFHARSWSKTQNGGQNRIYPALSHSPDRKMFPFKKGFKKVKSSTLWGDPFWLFIITNSQTMSRLKVTVLRTHLKACYQHNRDIWNPIVKTIKGTGAHKLETGTHQTLFNCPTTDAVLRSYFCAVFGLAFVPIADIDHC